MQSLIERYFHGIGSTNNQFSRPATAEKLAEAERQLHFELPDDYKKFLLASNGFEGFINEFYACFEPVETLFQSTKETCAEFFPWAVYIGSNGNAEMFVIDTRQKPHQFGLLPGIAVDSDFIPLGDTFEKFIERLYNNTAL